MFDIIYIALISNFYIDALLAIFRFRFNLYTLHYYIMLTLSPLLLRLCRNSAAYNVPLVEVRDVALKTFRKPS